MKASEEVGEKFYKLKTLSDTRFSAYLESSLDNFEKRIETTISALQTRVGSKDKDVKEKAAWLLKRILNKKFLITHLALIDLYRVLGTTSCDLQTVQQFPWDIGKKQRKLLDTLEKMSNLKLSRNEETEEVPEIDQTLWPKLGEMVDSVIDGSYVKAQTATDAGRRMGRSAKDLSASLDVLKTVENRVTNLCKDLIKHLKRRLKDNPTPEVIVECGNCLDMEDIIDKNEDDGIKQERVKSLKKVLMIAKYNQEETDLILSQYDVFKDSLNKVAKLRGENKEIVTRFQHLIFETHSCSKDCEEDCGKTGKVLEPLEPRMFKLLHLFLKEPTLYTGIEEFLHLLLR